MNLQEVHVFYGLGHLPDIIEGKEEEDTEGQCCDVLDDAQLIILGLVEKKLEKYICMLRSGNHREHEKRLKFYIIEYIKLIKMLKSGKSV